MDIPKLNELASQVQDRSTEALYLILAIDEAADDAVDCGDTSENEATKRADALDRIIVFSRMAKEAARRAIEIGEEIEGLSFGDRPARATSTAADA